MNHPLNEGVGRVAEAVVEVTGPYEEVVGEGGAWGIYYIRAKEVSELVYSAHTVYHCRALDIIQAFQYFE